MDRSTLYYHFPAKESLRLEVQWEYFIEAKHVAESYCSDHRYIGILAMALLWMQVQKDEHWRKFCQQSCEDYPIYTGKKDISYLHYAAHGYMWKNFVDADKISPMIFATVYGYLMSSLLLLCKHPERYDVWELYEHCCCSSLHIWGVSEEVAKEVLTTTKIYLDAIPVEALTFTC